MDHNYYLTDEQGSVRYVLDADGNVQNDYRYDAFGQRIAGHENILNRLRYNAQIEDDQTGLYYLRARYYNTGIGRFTKEDVIYNDGLNLYAYCSSNPVMYADPSGYMQCDKSGDHDIEFISENRVPLDRETILSSSDYVKTKNKVKGAVVYKKGDKYYYRDTLHKGKRAHIEVFDKKGKHLGEANPLTGKLLENSADKSKKLKIK